MGQQRSPEEDLDILELNDYQNAYINIRDN
jgi:hypothetical protein